MVDMISPRRVELWLPGGLPQEISPNRSQYRSHMNEAQKRAANIAAAKFAQAKAKLREQGRYLVYEQARGIRFERARVHVTLRVCRHRGANALFGGYRLYKPQDEDNLLASCKGLFDGVVDAGLLPDDRSPLLRIGGIDIEEVAAVSQAGLLLVFEEVLA